MNETLKTINDRYSCRDFSSEPLSGEEIKALTTAALASPSAMNKMPWHIIVVTDKALIEEMDTESMAILAAMDDKGMYNRMKERGGKLFYNAPCMIFIAGDGSEYSQLDCGIVSQNIALAAHSLGLGSVICAMARIPLDGAKGNDFKNRLKFPEGYSFGMSVCIGKAKSGKAPHEHDLNKVTYV